MSETYSVRVLCLNCGLGCPDKWEPKFVNVTKGLETCYSINALECENCGCKNLTQYYNYRKIALKVSGEL